MTRAASQTAAFVFPALALLWPWEVYEYVPGIGMSCSELIGAAVVALFALDVLRRRRLHVPFEFAWPAAVWALFEVAPLFRETGAATAERAGAAVLFLATVHFSHSRRVARDLLWVAALSGACAAAWAITASAMGVAPTVYFIESKTASTLPAGPCNSVLILAVCLALASGFAWQGFLGKSWFKGVLVLVCALFCLAALAPMIAALPSGAVDAHTGSRAAAVLLLWLVCRIMAKAVVASWPSVQEEAGKHGNGDAVLLRAVAVGLGLAVLAGLFCHARITWAHGFLLGLAAAYALPAREPAAAAQRFRYILLPACVALVAFNAFHVDIDDVLDPRNYEAQARTRFEAEAFDDVVRLMDAVDAAVPGERRTAFWKARAYLAKGAIHRAARAFSQAVRPVDDDWRTVLPLAPRDRTPGLSRSSSGWVFRVCPA